MGYQADAVKQAVIDMAEACTGLPPKIVMGDQDLPPELSGNEKHPDSVTVVGSTIIFELNDAVGTSDASGKEVRVWKDGTPEIYEDLTVEWVLDEGVDPGNALCSGKNKVTTAGLLGQTPPTPPVSTIAADYLVDSFVEHGTAWSTTGGTPPQVTVDGIAEYIEGTLVSWLNSLIAQHNHLLYDYNNSSHPSTATTVALLPVE